MKKYAGLLVLSALTGCASTITPLIPTSEGDITDRPYALVADISTEIFIGSLDHTPPQEQCLAKMKQDVIQQGANGLIFVRYGETGYDWLLRHTLRCSGRAVRF